MAKRDNYYEYDYDEWGESDNHYDRDRSKRKSYRDKKISKKQSRDHLFDPDDD